MALLINLNSKKEISRIISLVPSITELLFDLELDNKIVGITRFCIKPVNKVLQVSKIGGTKDINIDTVRGLKPDLIIANKEENSKEQILELSNDFDILLTDVNSYEGSLAMINNIGLITKTEEKANEIIDKINSEFANINTKLANITTAYFIWRNPYMTISGETFINSILSKIGCKNVFAEQAENYPVISEEEIIDANPEIVLLSSEPFNFTEKHITEFKEILPNANTVLVDGEFFSWYGSRMIYAPKYFEKLLQIVSDSVV